MKRSGLLWCVGAVLMVSVAVPAQQETAKPKHGGQAESKGETSKPRRKRIVVPAAGFELADTSKLASQPMVGGGGRALFGPHAFAPMLGKMYGASALFEWSYPQSTEKFTLVVRNDQSSELLRQEVSGTQFRYPNSAPRFDPGKTYSWTVEAASDGSTSAPARFVVASPGERAEIEKALAEITNADPYESGLGRARVFTEHRLWYDVIGAYTDLIARFPDRAELYKERGKVYAQLEVTKRLADVDFKRAGELQARHKSQE